jgi:sugar lactone lactonase YvrE
MHIFEGMLCAVPTLFGLPPGRIVETHLTPRELDMVIELPVRKVTACTFGGERLDQLYITTARIGLDAQGLAEQPLAGALFRYHTGPIGLPSVPYAG